VRISKRKDENLRERLAAYLRNEVFSGRLKPGQRIVESQIARKMDVGQPTIREALQVLEHEGLITRISRKGCRVADLSVQDIIEIYAVRIELESLAAGNIPAAEIPRVVSKLEQKLLKMNTAEKSNDTTAFRKADIEFHRVIWQAGGNKYLVKALEAVTSPLFAIFYRSTMALGPRDTDAHREFLEIIRSDLPREERINMFRRTMSAHQAEAVREFEGEARALAEVAEAIPEEAEEVTESA
jgi:DNA-binding GntR family transcriptional regulator